MISIGISHLKWNFVSSHVSRVKMDQHSLRFKCRHATASEKLLPANRFPMAESRVHVQAHNSAHFHIVHHLSTNTKTPSVQRISLLMGESNREHLKKIIGVFDIELYLRHKMISPRDHRGASGSNRIKLSFPKDLEPLEQAVGSVENDGDFWMNEQIFRSSCGTYLS